MPGAALAGDGEIVVTGVQLDSRKVKPGDVFVAVTGSQQDGTRFVPSAIESGAVAIVADRSLDVSVPVIVVPNAGKAAGQVAASFYGHPSKKLRVTGITGTDGKTSTTHMLHAIFTAAGHKTGLSSTVRQIINEDIANPTGLTTPDPVTVQATLAAMVDAGCRRAVLEVSSHALEQARVDDVVFTGALCTNLDPEHLDYHKTFDAYAKAKSRLFALVAATSHRSGIVYNADQSSSELLMLPPSVRAMPFGMQNGRVRAINIQPTPSGTCFDLVTPVGNRTVSTRFIGDFNVMNWTAVAALAVLEGISLNAIADAMRITVPVAGRLELVDCGQPFQVVVDFAHTPQALSHAISTLRARTIGKLIVVFGHAGERDPENRPRMGEAALAADYLVNTMDDPYSEDPEEIAAVIEQAIISGDQSKPFETLIDRRAAIHRALSLAQSGDTVLIAGRGHETTIVWGSRTIEFHDATVARQELETLGYRDAHQVEAMNRAGRRAE